MQSHNALSLVTMWKAISKGSSKRKIGGEKTSQASQSIILENELGQLLVELE